MSSTSQQHPIDIYSAKNRGLINEHTGEITLPQYGTNMFIDDALLQGTVVLLVDSLYHVACHVFFLTLYFFNHPLQPFFVSAKVVSPQLCVWVIYGNIGRLWLWIFPGPTSFTH